MGGRFSQQLPRKTHKPSYTPPKLNSELAPESRGGVLGRIRSGFPIGWKATFQGRAAAKLREGRRWISISFATFFFLVQKFSFHQVKDLRSECLSSLSSLRSQALPKLGWEPTFWGNWVGAIRISNFPFTLPETNISRPWNWMVGRRLPFLLGFGKCSGVNC